MALLERGPEGLLVEKSPQGASVFLERSRNVLHSILGVHMARKKGSQDAQPRSRRKMTDAEKARRASTKAAEAVAHQAAERAAQRNALVKLL